MPRDGKSLQADRAQIQEEGFESHTTMRLNQKLPWYREDGSLVGVLPVDTYHEQRFRAKGWHLSPRPTLANENKHFLGFAESAGAPPHEPEPEQKE